MSIVIQVDRLSKRYRLGTIGGKRLVDDVNRWWAKLRGQDDPLSKVGSVVRGQSSRGPHEEAIWALKDVSFEVNQGEVLGIIGRNGAGKSTLLKILSRVTAPTSGEVRVKGRIASLLEVGTGFHPELTGRENIFLNGAILGMTKVEIRSKFDEIVAFSEVEQFIDTPVKRYSSGMHVRLAFAVAAHLEPEILIVDEVLAVGDVVFQKKCLGKMQDVAGKGRTVIFVSHNLSAIENLCSYCLIMSLGRVQAFLPARDAIAEYCRTCPMDKKETLGCLGKIVQSVDLVDASGSPQLSFRCGDDVAIRIRLLPIPGVGKVSVGIGIDDVLGTRLATILTKFKEFEMPNLSEAVTVKCILRNLPFAPGSYQVKVAISNTSGDIESHERVASLRVEAANFYGCGHLPGTRQGYILLSHDWEVAD